MTSWLTSAIQTVREKSNNALDFVRRDLNEFTTTVKTDTEGYLNKIKTQEMGDLSINRFVSKFSDAAKTDNESEKQFQASAAFDRVHSEITRLQDDESTYLIDPTPLESYEHWRQSTDFNVDTRKGEIAQLLIDAPHVRSFYAHLVPAQTTHTDFWSRYYFRVHQIEEEEARRTQLLRRAHEICSETSENTEKNNETDWDEVDEDGSVEAVNLPEKSTLEIISVEEPKELVVVTPTLEKANKERTESDTISGDSWEREFDENDVAPTKPTVGPLTESRETIASESLSSSTAALPSLATLVTEKKTSSEFDDEWEGWA